MEKETVLIERKKQTLGLLKNDSVYNKFKSNIFLNRKTLSGVGVGALGAVGVLGLMGMVNIESPLNENGDPLYSTKPDINATIREATSVKGDMDFQEAFKTARNEVGPNGYFVYDGKAYNTLYKEEMDSFSNEEQKKFYDNIIEQYQEDHHVVETTNTDQHQHNIAIVIYDHAPVADNINNAMSFNDAFAVARAEVGPGGVFEWQGKLYNTYTQEELHSMTDTHKQEFYASIDNQEIIDSQVSINDVDINSIDQTTANMNNDKLLETAVVNIDGYNVPMQAYDHNGQIYFKADFDNNGSYETTISNDALGNIHIDSPAGSDIITKEELAQTQPDWHDANQGLNMEYNYTSELDSNADLDNHHNEGDNLHNDFNNDIDANHHII